MKIKEEYISIGNAKEIFSIIATTLQENENTQVYLSIEIFNELERNGHKYNVFTPNYVKTFHYYHDSDNFGGESWLQLTENYALSKTIARASFINNCKGYMQLVQFEGFEIKEYTHFLTGLKQILFIYSSK